MDYRSCLVKGQSGQDLVIETNVDVTTLTGGRLDVLKPSGKVESWEPVSASGTNKLVYTVSEGDLDEVGQYIVNPYVELESFTGHLTPVSFLVIPVAAEEEAPNE